MEVQLVLIGEAHDECSHRCWPFLAQRRQTPTGSTPQTPQPAHSPPAGRQRR
ncbi:hypothetical protein F751_5783 [Auxenochlorella protothecoides]|uniref:Uncharacterized protein n=1 Tax=Auxenochlorella protothecoides TaxID=3075 RepID=A0A087SUE1_AUXPR|nr:hypothetical protein F751_5783 [Auxenochlorella protothecoides]KFM29345.1 hypothetical protein F751_5783 [Auxenochlorella protothecoides]